MVQAFLVEATGVEPVSNNGSQRIIRATVVYSLAILSTSSVFNFVCSFFVSVLTVVTSSFAFAKIDFTLSSASVTNLRSIAVA